MSQNRALQHHIAGNTSRLPWIFAVDSLNYSDAAQYPCHFMSPTVLLLPAVGSLMRCVQSVCKCVGREDITLHSKEQAIRISRRDLLR